MPQSSDEVGAESSPGKIFISYRREDTQSVVGRLYDRLADIFGEESVLKDVDSIPFGADFREYSTRLVKESDVVLVLIGPQWLRRRDDGTRRIDDEADLVRLEVEAALQHCSLVIPVLVGDIEMPTASDLPAPIAGLVFRNAAQLRHDPDFRVDCARLVQQLEQRRSAHSTPKPSPPAEPDASPIVFVPAVVSPPSIPNVPEPGTRAGENREFGDPAIPFCWCPGGTFKMGRKSEKKSVALPLGFWLGRTVITQAQWIAVMQTELWRKCSGVRQGADYPAVCISWNDAFEFCTTLTEREREAGRLSWNWSYTLPTEAQWEYACRAGTTTRFCFGDDDAELGKYAWFDCNARDLGANYAHPVGTKKANAWGLFDMHGNVWEWCRDVYTPNLSGGRDPYVAAGSSDRVKRGGSWICSARIARSAIRDWNGRSYRDWTVGFRLACVPSG